MKQDRSHEKINIEGKEFRVFRECINGTSVDKIKKTVKGIKVNSELLVPVLGIDFGLYLIMNKHSLNNKARAILCPTYFNRRLFIHSLIERSDVNRLIIADPNVRLNRYVSDKNPFPGLEGFIGEEYNSSLRFDELQEFEGSNFGGRLRHAYLVTCNYGERELRKSFWDKRPEPGDEFKMGEVSLEVQHVTHRGFARKTFREVYDIFYEKVGITVRDT